MGILPRNMCAFVIWVSGKSSFTTPLLSLSLCFTYSTEESHSKIHPHGARAAFSSLHAPYSTCMRCERARLLFSWPFAFLYICMTAPYTSFTQLPPTSGWYFESEMNALIYFFSKQSKGNGNCILVGIRAGREGGFFFSSPNYILVILFRVSLMVDKIRYK